MLLEFRSVKKYYPGPPPVTVLTDATFGVAEGDVAAIVGPSGSGKTTVLNLASGLDTPSEGDIRIAGKSIAHLTEDELSGFRLRELGFVFQNFHLLPSLTALENVEFPLVVRGDADAKDRAREALRRVGLGEKERSFPAQLSGGQQQRVSIARALAGSPKIVIADEPTANLDPRTALELIELFLELNAKDRVTLLFSTHDMRLVERVKRRLHVVDGRVIE